MNREQTNYINRLKAFFNWDYSKGEVNDREQIKDLLVEEFEDSNY